MSSRMRTKLAVRMPRRRPQPHRHLLAEEPRLTKQHYKILALCWAGWVFDIYDLILFIKSRTHNRVRVSTDK